MDFQTRTPYTYINTDSALESLLADLSSVRRVAVDIEADSLHHYFEKICLIQITFLKTKNSKLKTKNYIVDPLCGIDIDKLLLTLANKDMVFHGGDYDLRMLLSSYGFKPCAEVFDTMLAAQLLGLEKCGLGALLEQFFGVEVSKKNQRADWSKRPLKESLLDYACNDTSYLLTLADLLTAELNNLRRLNWHKQYCQAMVLATREKKAPDKKDDIWRIKGSRLMSSGQLLFLRQLWQWRQKQAKMADIPPFKIMHNSMILELAVWLAENKNVPLEKGPKLGRNIKGRTLNSLNDAITKASQTPRSQWPGPKKRKKGAHYDPNTKLLAEELKDQCTRIAEKLGIAPSIIASRATLTALAKKQPKNTEEIIKAAAIMPWQAKIIEPAIKTVFKK